MIVSRNSEIAAKRDLHVGGLGSTASAGLSTVLEPANDYSEPLWRNVRDFLRSADDAIHDNPWAAIGAVGLLGLAAGYLLSRRS